MNLGPRFMLLRIYVAGNLYGDALFSWKYAYVVVRSFLLTVNNN